VNRFLKCACCVCSIRDASAAMAQDEKSPTAPTAGRRSSHESSAIYLGGAFGAGLGDLGAGYGMARSFERRREMLASRSGRNIQPPCIISAALIEGVTLLALIVCMLFNN